MVAFADAIPTLRIATDLKVELFRDPGRPWKPSTLYDIDAISMAIPYCHLVVPDKQMANFLGRSRAGERNGTEVVTKLDDLPRRLEPLVARARGFAGDVTGWNALGPGHGWDPLDPDAGPPDALVEALSQERS